MWVGRLIVANILVFFFTMSSPDLFRALVFVPSLVLVRPWTLVSYMFLHADLWHLAVNMLSLFFFGPRLEATIGSRDFLRLYFLSGVGGAVLSFLLGPDVPIVGASGATFGVLLGFAYYWPRAQIYLWGILPVEARWMVIGMAVISIYSARTGMGAGIAHFAHLGGFAGGWAYLRWRRRRREQGPIGPAAAAALERISGQMRQDIERWRQIPLETLHPINREEVERVLQKLDATGIGSLTPDERAFLDRMSRTA